MKDMHLLFIAVSLLLTTGCSNSVYKSTGNTYKINDKNYEYAIIKKQIRTTAQEGADTEKYDIKINPKYAKIGAVDNVIIGTLLKQGLSIVTEEQLNALGENSKNFTLVVEWGVSGRDDKFMGYSQEVTVLIKDAVTRQIVYKGSGEGMGEDEIADVRIALEAALVNFNL
jgi:hypothetical protein